MSETESWAMLGKIDWTFDGEERKSADCEMTLHDGLLTLNENESLWKGRMSEPGQYEMRREDGNGQGFLNVVAPDVFEGRFTEEGCQGEWSIVLDADLEW